ncbi:Enhancer of filamentation 1 [Macaca fascicularis]|uniref:Enhancer of filamentation 1 n=1 Tax=Macaca fascicularis TaxID=9541 RepID=G7P4F0_MACFA|nr:Enhancer of filamentation 1 [Macaca fascicularis]
MIKSTSLEKKTEGKSPDNLSRKSHEYVMNLMARALYDNVPECAEELAFRKGDILTVIEQNTGGLEGWWLCSLHGRQGIVPGNRVKLLIGPVQETTSSHDQPASGLMQQTFGQQKLYQVPNPQAAPRDTIYQVPPSYQNQGIYQVPTGHGTQEQEVYQVPPSVQRSIGGTSGPHVGKKVKFIFYYISPVVFLTTHRRPNSSNKQQKKTQWGHGLWHTASHERAYHTSPELKQAYVPSDVKVITPVRTGHGYVYEYPSRYQKDVYDIPPSHTTQGVYDIPPSSVKGPVFSVPVGEIKPQGVYDIPPTKGVYAIPPSACRDEAGLREKDYDFPPPMRQVGRADLRPEGVYDIPPTSAKPAGKDLHVKYNCDIPGAAEPVARRHQSLSPNHPPPQLGQSVGSHNDAYDVPRGVQFLEPPAETSEKANPQERDGVYDVPLHNPPDAKGSRDLVDGINRLSFSSTGSTRSNMSTSSTSSKESSLSASPAQDKRLLLDPDTAIERLQRLQQALEMGVSSLMALVTTDWRCYGYMERHINEIRTAVDKVELFLKEYLHFVKGAVANAACLPELVLHNKMKRELQRVEDSHQILSQTSHDLNECSWSLNILAINKPQNKCDDLDRFVMVAKTVPDDAKQLTTTINTNAEALFRPGPGSLHLKNGPESIMNSTEYPHSGSQGQLLHPGDHKAQAHNKALPPGLSKEQAPDCSSSDGSERSWMDDYDYVHLQGKEEFERQQKELLEKENIMKQNKMQLEHHQLSQFQLLEQEITKPVENDISKWKPSQSLPTTNGGVSAQDRQLLCFYYDQCETHFISLLNAIEALFSCVSSAQPPRIFVAHSKFVILSAHKLVFIGDTLTRQVTAQDIRNKVMNSSNQLCEQLKTIVMATKMAALHYPSTTALQEMVHQVTDLSRNAQLFKRSLLEMATF